MTRPVIASRLMRFAVLACIVLLAARVRGAILIGIVGAVGLMLTLSLSLACAPAPDDSRITAEPETTEGCAIFGPLPSSQARAIALRRQAEPRRSVLPSPRKCRAHRAIWESFTG